MELCRAWLSAGPVAWQAVRGAANRGDLGLEGSLVFLFAQDGYWTGSSTEGSHIDLEGWVWKQGRVLEICYPLFPSAHLCGMRVNTSAG